MAIQRVSFVSATLALAAVFFLSAAQAPAGVIPPPDLPAGSQYQVIFLTHDTMAAIDTGIGSYNQFVSDEASTAGSILPVGDNIAWKAIGSTLSVDANQNAPTSAGIPIYTPSGILVAKSGDQLWQTTSSVQLLSRITEDQYGNLWAMEAWTGSNSDGTKAIGKELGQWSSTATNNREYGPEIGCGAFPNSWWLDVGQYSNNQGSQAQTLSLYGLSNVITVPLTVPEPSVLVLLATGAAGLLVGFGRRRLAKG
jgi:hypothetical protein